MTEKQTNELVVRQEDWDEEEAGDRLHGLVDGGRLV